MEILNSPASLLQILFVRVLADPTNTKTRCEIFSKLTIKTQNDYNDVVLASLLFNLNKFHKLFWCVRCWIETRNFRQGVEEVNCRNLFLTCKICSALTLKIFLDQVWKISLKARVKWICFDFTYYWFRQDCIYISFLKISFADEVLIVLSLC